MPFESRGKKTFIIFHDCIYTCVIPVCIPDLGDSFEGIVKIRIMSPCIIFYMKHVLLYFFVTIVTQGSTKSAQINI